MKRELPTADSRVYYVYMLLDDREPNQHSYGRFKFPAKPLYCGMGYNGRAKMHARGANGKAKHSKTQKNIRIRNIQKATGSDPTIHYIKKNLTQQEAFDLERKIVQLVGRLQLKTGPLTNLSDGGEGQKNVVHTPEYRAKRSAKKTEWWAGRTKEEIKNLVDKVQTTRKGWTLDYRNMVLTRLSESATKQNAAMSAAQIKARSKAYRATCAARTAEKRAELSATLSGARKRAFEAMTELEYFEFHAQVTKARLKTYANLSDKEKAKIKKVRSAAMKAHWDGLSKEARSEIGALISAGLQSMSEKDKAKRNKRISKSLTVVYAADPKIKKRAAKANSITRQNYTDEQHEHMSSAVSLGHANRSEYDKKKSAKKMSKSGKARVAAMTDKERRTQSKSLSTALTEHHSTLTKDERSARILKGHLSKDHAKINKKIAKSTIEAHARMSVEDKAAKAEKIRQTLLNRPPEVLQRLAAGNFMRGLLKREVGDVKHKKYRPKLEALIADTKWTGLDKTLTKFKSKAEALFN